MSVKKFRRKDIIFFVVTSSIILLVSFFLSNFYLSKTSIYERTMNDHWCIYVDDELIAKDCDLTKIRLGNLPRNTKIQLRRQLSKEDAGGYSIALKTYLSSVEAYVDSELVYSYGTEELKNNRMVSSGYHFINFPNETNDKLFIIDIQFNQKGAFTVFDTIKVAPTRDIRLAFAHELIVYSMIGFFLIALGIVFILISLLVFSSNQSVIRLAWIGAFAVAIGGWIIKTNNILQIFSAHYFGTSFEYLFLYIAPIFFLSILNTLIEDQGFFNKVVRSVRAIFIAFFVVATVLHITNVCRYPALLLGFHGLIVSLSCLIIYACLKLSHEDYSKNYLLFFSLMAFLSILLIDIARFVLYKYVVPDLTFLSASLLPVGGFLSIVLMFCSYLIKVYENALIRNEEELLLKMAYSDALSGLYNRAKFMEEIAELQKLCMEYAVICYDINGLKEINDTLGHDQGDILIKSFSDVLKDNFGDIGVNFRIGGDEFVTIVLGKSIDHIPEKIEAMQLQEDSLSKQVGFTIEAAYGIAYSSQATEMSVEEIIKIADRAMYSMKKEMKSENR